jgi:hypothetical protein
MRLTPFISAFFLLLFPLPLFASHLVPDQIDAVVATVGNTPILHSQILQRCYVRIGEVSPDGDIPQALKQQIFEELALELLLLYEAKKEIVVPIELRKELWRHTKQELATYIQRAGSEAAFEEATQMSCKEAKKMFLQRNLDQIRVKLLLQQRHEALSSPSPKRVEAYCQKAIEEEADPHLRRLVLLQCIQYPAIYQSLEQLQHDMQTEVAKVSHEALSFEELLNQRATDVENPTEERSGPYLDKNLEGPLQGLPAEVAIYFDQGEYAEPGSISNAHIFQNCNGRKGVRILYIHAWKEIPLTSDSSFAFKKAYYIVEQKATQMRNLWKTHASQIQIVDNAYHKRPTAVRPVQA